MLYKYFKNNIAELLATLILAKVLADVRIFCGITAYSIAQPLKLIEKISLLPYLTVLLSPQCLACN